MYLYLGLFRMSGVLAMIYFDGPLMLYDYEAHLLLQVAPTMKHRYTRPVVAGEGASLHPEFGPKQRGPVYYVKLLSALLFCCFVWYRAGVFHVMLYSSRIHVNLLYLSYGCHALSTGVGLWLTWVVGRTHPNWDKDPLYSTHIHVGTLAIVLGGLLWTIALFPVFHIWTVPLGLLGWAAAAMVLMLMPSAKKSRVA